MAQPNDSKQPKDTTFDELFRPLEEQLEQHEQVHPPHHREKFHFKDFAVVGIPLHQGLRVGAFAVDRQGLRARGIGIA